MAETSNTTSLMIFTRDLRIDDNPALCAAAATENLECLFVIDTEIFRSGTASKRRGVFLNQCLADLSKSLEERGAHLDIVTGNWSQEVRRRIRELNPRSVHISDDYSSYAKHRLNNLSSWCIDHGVALHRHPGVAAVPPAQITPGGGGEYKVFTPYWRSWLTAPKRCLFPPPNKLPGSSAKPQTPNPVLSVPESTILVGGESQALEHLNRWLHNGIANYEKQRDIPAVSGTSLLSPYLHFGCVSALRLMQLAEGVPGADVFLRQLAWRDFYTQILDARPDSSRHDYRDRGDQWEYKPQAFESWTNGMTGFPLVDAGMRQLRAEGLMHNRVRMVTASFLIKDLHQDWRLGADYFMSQLLDGDVASNYLNWQWIAGTGTDNNPHRVLNPTTQAKRFDPNAEYIGRWVPELSRLTPSDAINPPISVRSQTGYPATIVDHQQSIEAFKRRRLAHSKNKSK